jgi:hypothetical protein
MSEKDPGRKPDSKKPAKRARRAIRSRPLRPKPAAPAQQPREPGLEEGGQGSPARPEDED